jgi:hypothetical protein
LVKEVNIIEENDTMWDVVGYFNVDPKLVWWIWKLMNIIFKILIFLFHLTKILLVSTLVAKCNG